MHAGEQWDFALLGCGLLLHAAWGCRSRRPTRGRCRRRFSRSGRGRTHRARFCRGWSLSPRRSWSWKDWPRPIFAAWNASSARGRRKTRPGSSAADRHCCWPRRATCSCCVRPRNEGEPIWFQRATEFRTAAVQLAGSMGQSRITNAAGPTWSALAGTCNRCHQSFRIRVQIKPFDDQLKVSQ